MAGFTNRGKYAMLGQIFNTSATTIPASYYAALVKTTPTQDTNTLSDLTEIATGNGYTSGGIQCGKDTTAFPSLTEDDGADKGTIGIKNLVWTAAGGPLPSDSAGATYLVLTDDNATIQNRNVYAYFSLGGARVVSDTQTLTISGAVLSFNES